MAHTHSGKKSIRSSARKRTVNRRNTSILRTCTKKFYFEFGKTKPDVNTLKLLFIGLQKVTDKSVTKGVLKKNTASRRVANANTKLRQVVLSSSK